MEHVANGEDGAGPWAPVSLGPFLERRSESVLKPGLKAAVRPNLPGEKGGRDVRRRQTAETLGGMLGGEVDVRYRPDGKPQVAGFAVSSSHGAGVTFAVASPSDAGLAVACDVEAALERGEPDWAGLLGPAGFGLARFVAAEAAEGLSTAGTRIWGAFEALSKTGRPRADLVLDGAPRTDGWVLLRSGAARIATFGTLLAGGGDPAVFTMLAERSR